MENIKQKAIFVSLIIFVITLPFEIRYNSFAMILVAFCWIAEGNLYNKFREFLKNKLALLFCTLYFLCILGLVYTEQKNIREGFFELEQKSALLVMPLILLSLDKMYFNAKRIYYILFSFTIACFIATIACLIYISKNSLFDKMIIDTMATGIGIHRVYFSMFIGFSILFLFYFLSKFWQSLTAALRMTIIALILYFIAYNFLLFARTSLIALFITIIVFSLLHFQSNRIKVAIVSIAILFPVCFVLFALNNKEVKRSIKEVINPDYYKTPDASHYWNSTSQRVAQWATSGKVIKDNILTGVGTGDVQSELDKVYKVDYWENPGDVVNYNSHNQYLQVGVAWGFIGIAFFLLTLAVPMVLAWRKKDFFFFSFLLLFSLCCITESLLERQKGIVFYSFFNSLLAFNYIPVSREKKEVHLPGKP